MKKLVIMVMVVLAVVNACFGYGVKGMRRGVTKSSYSTKRSSGGSVSVKGYVRKDGTYVSGHTRRAPGTGSYSTTRKSGHIYNGYVPTIDDKVEEKKEEKPHDWNKDIRTGLAIVRTANQTASTINRINNSNARVEIARENLEIRKYNSGLGSKYGTKTEGVPVVVRRVDSNQDWYKSRYEYFKEQYDAETDKNSNLARFYLERMKEYEGKLEKK